MKILVLSDSHSGLSFMQYAYEKVRPDMVIHLGDYFDDAESLKERFPDIRLQQVPGNCDLYRQFTPQPEIRIISPWGIRIYMTHGHRHGVKSGLYHLAQSAREASAAIVLYGHTHEAYCCREPDGLWILNPGACGSYSGSVGLIQIDNGAISSCRILRQSDLEVM